MKRILALLLSFVLLLSLAACGGEKEREWYPYDLSEYISLEDWHGVKAEYDDPTMCTEEEIDESVLQVMLTYADFQPKEGAAEKYDMVEFDYYVYFGDEFLDDSSNSGYQLVIGQAGMSDMDYTMCQALIGCAAGDSAATDYTYPDSTYLYGAMAGKIVRLTAEVSAVYSPTLPECNDEFVQSLSGFGFQTVEEFRDAVREEILAQKVENRVYAVWQAFSASAQVLKYPKAEVKAYEDDYLRYYQEYADEYKLSLDEFLREYFSSSEEEFREEAKKYAEDMVKNDMIFTQLSRTMGTTLSDEEYEQGLQEYFDREAGNFDDMDAYVAYYGEKILRENLIWDKSLRAMAEVAVRIE